MGKQIEVGEMVIGSTGIGKYGTRQVIGRLHQKPATRYDPYLVMDRDGLLHPCHKIRRLRRVK